MYATWRGRATGPLTAYVMVEEAPLAQPCANDDDDEDDEELGATFGLHPKGDLEHPCRLLDGKAWMQHRRMAGFALVATFVMCVVASARLRSLARDSPELPEDGVWSVGLGRPRYTVEAEEQSNPYAFYLFYQSPLKKAEFASSIASSTGIVRKRLETMRDVATAVWVDRKAMIRGSGSSSLEGILEDASWKVTAELVTLVVHNLPNRDCSSKAPKGELCCARAADGSCDLDAQDGGCEEALREYRQDYVDPLVQVLHRYKGAVPVVVILEPGAVPSLVAHGKSPRCGGAATSTAYREGLRYAAEQLAEKTPWVTIYLDAAHGGLLGWHGLTVRYFQALKDMRLPLRKIRGFATNVANYRPLGKAVCPWVPSNGSNAYCLNGGASDPCCEDPCGLLEKGNPANSELNYAQELVRNAKQLLHMDAHVLTDSSRNGQAGAQTACGGGCNVRQAGAGHASTAKVHSSAEPFIDAYFWIKTPGESDGCARLLPSGEECLRYDERCASEDSLGSRPDEARAPQAGQWFDSQAKQLALLADLGLDEEAQALLSMRKQEQDVRNADWR